MKMEIRRIGKTITFDTTTRAVISDAEFVLRERSPGLEVTQANKKQGETLVVCAMHHVFFRRLLAGELFAVAVQAN